MMRPRATAGAVVVIAATLALAGCGSSPSGFAERSVGWQARVASIANDAAAGNSVAAIAELTALQAELDGAQAAGAVTTARADLIRSAIDLVRHDLSGSAPTATPTTAATAAPSPAPAPATPSTDTTVIAPPQPAPPSTPATGNGNSNGKGDGNGNGKGKAKGSGD